MKYYGVKSGRKLGIYSTWSECEAQVKGYSGAQYKSFALLSDAKSYINDQIDVPNVEIVPEKVTSQTQTCDIEVYTDGSCIDSIGGYGIVYITDGVETEFFGQVPYEVCTNNIAELYAIKSAVELILKYNASDKKKITIYSDSIYSIKSLTIWYSNWKKNGWRTSNGEEVKNKELIQSILTLMKEIPNLKFQHVAGHSNIRCNEMADRLANRGRTSISI
jgi:ribonuclease HI